MWPFKKNSATEEELDVEAPVTPEPDPTPDRGPFNGDSVEITDFDFSDFSDGTLDLGSIKVPMPRPSEVQVEMGPDGPRMVHIVTKVGRITPVAFASTASGGLWQESVTDIIAGMRNDGLEATTEQGPWGEEVVGVTEHATIRMIGVEGDRWTLRVTLAAPNEFANDLAELGREVVARTFVYRGEQPMMAGTVLPVVMPAPLVEQVQKAMAERAAAAQQPAPAPVPEPAAPVEPTPNTTDLSHDEGSALEQMQQRSDSPEHP